MTRYIDADALIEQMEADAEHIDNDIVQMMLYSSINDVKNAPTADVVPTEFHDKCMRIEIEKRMNMERKKGEWKPHPTEREWDVCSNCGIGVHRREYGYNEDGTEWVEEVSYMFCPWCGADMRGEKER